MNSFSRLGLYSLPTRYPLIPFLCPLLSTGNTVIFYKDVRRRMVHAADSEDAFYAIMTLDDTFWSIVLLLPKFVAYWPTHEYAPTRCNHPWSKHPLFGHTP